MKDFENRLLEQYCIDVNGVRKTRGGFLCDTKQGLLLLKQLTSSEKKIAYTKYICQQLKENGFDPIDGILVDKNGNDICGTRDFGNYILKSWYTGRECDINREQDIIEATKRLAYLHIALQQVSNQIRIQQEDLLCDNRWNEFGAKELIEEWKRHNQELRKVRKFIRKKVAKGEFEGIYLENFVEMQSLAEAVVIQLEKSRYRELYQEAITNHLLVHGDYNYHNVVNLGKEIAVVNFEHFQVDIPVTDFYYFLRKVMEKREWDIELGQKMVRSYEAILPLCADEKEYISLRMLYPEKFWKITNYYYNTNKAWISEKSIEKLKISIQQVGIKREFVQQIFTFNLPKASV